MEIQVYEYIFIEAKAASNSKKDETSADRFENCRDSNLGLLFCDRCCVP